MPAYKLTSLFRPPTNPYFSDLRQLTPTFQTSDMSDDMRADAIDAIVTAVESKPNFEVISFLVYYPFEHSHQLPCSMLFHSERRNLRDDGMLIL